ncbi:glycerol kinase GlpK [Undibacterium flavidum]|uniref:Glycerol kinase n=1 Tax=Undibacterium flavidum TaxID=2762297 RepID=A0ABR6YAA3_9BURK|nr:glycerol kinase GlpK [Undibacterium flavidum]MBC3873526.1 glycerol kinase GlpK [Undibacterium flavidum]
MAYLLALDQGTSSSRSIIFDQRGNIISTAQQEFTQYFPQAAWVEHDAMEIWHSQRATIQQVLQQSGLQAQQISAIGITNQRETTILWNRKTGLPLGPAIVWQDRRTARQCEDLREQGYAKLIQEKTGLILDPYFSASKIAWILQHIPDARAQAQRGELAFGTVDSWLAYQLSGQQLHVTDVTNASRTMLWNIHTREWDKELLALFDIPRSLLPEVCPSSYYFGDCHLFGSAIPIAGIAGDQQAALFGQACFRTGMAKNTYGTGCFALLQTGAFCSHSQHGLISTAACQIDQHPQYALEGSVFIGGAVVQWLRDYLHLAPSAKDIDALASSVPDSDGVIFVPAFTGLGAPYWDANARGAILGLHRGSSAAHIARAAIEAIAFQTAELLMAMQKDSPTPILELRVDGGAATNTTLLQFQADLLGIPVVRPRVLETTALGAAYLAGLQTGVYSNPEECSALWQEQQRFLPQISRTQADHRLQIWKNAVARLL